MPESIDYTPLADLPLRTLLLDFKPGRDTELLRSIKTLVSINDKPATDFWRDVDSSKK